VRLSIEPRCSQSEHELRLLELSFQHGFLSGRARAGQLDEDEQRQLSDLRHLFEGDPLHSRRRHRRYAAFLPVVIDTGASQGHGILLNFSTGGLFLATHQEVETGGSILVKIGRPGKVEYLYSCEVMRARRGPWINGIACRVAAPPVELRAYS
jgi:hypothetical protein